MYWLLARVAGAQRRALPGRLQSIIDPLHPELRRRADDPLQGGFVARASLSQLPCAAWILRPSEPVETCLSVTMSRPLPLPSQNFC
jgi:hypothetical protein